MQCRSELCSTSDEVASAEEHKFWLKLHSVPETKVAELWERTARARLTAIQAEGKILNEILAEWPRYRDFHDRVSADAYLFCFMRICCHVVINNYFDADIRCVSITVLQIAVDFEKLFPDQADSFIKNWCFMAPAVLTLLGRSKERNAVKIHDLIHSQPTPSPGLLRDYSLMHSSF